MVEMPSQSVELGSTIPDFSFPNMNPAHGGDTVSLEDFDSCGALLVVFMCNHCPYVLHIVEKLADVVRRYQARGLGAVGISVNDVGAYPKDAPRHMTAMAEKYRFSFSYLYDESQRSAREFGAVCTPDLFLYDADRRLAYHGQFDGSRPGNGVPVSGKDLVGALDAVLEGKTIPVPQAPSVGCSIKWKPGQAP